MTIEFDDLCDAPMLGCGLMVVYKQVGRGRRAPSGAGVLGRRSMGGVRAASSRAKRTRISGAGVLGRGQMGRVRVTGAGFLGRR